MHYQWRNTFLITRSSGIGDAVTRRIAAMVSCPIGVRISTGPNRGRLCHLVTARKKVPKGLPRSRESFTNTSQAGAQESNRDRACAELKYGTIRYPTTATAVLPMTSGAWPQCAISVWSDKLTISKQRSRSRVATSRVTLFGLNALVSRTARMFLRTDQADLCAPRD